MIKQNVTPYYRVSDALWDKFQTLLPAYEFGRPRKQERNILNGILYVCVAGCGWNHVPKEFASRSSCNRRFLEWQRAGVWDRFLLVIQKQLPKLKTHALVDGTFVPSKKGAIKTASAIKAKAQLF